MSTATVNGSAARDYARDYLSAGLSTIPIRGDGSKSPALNSWKQYESRLPSDAELSGMFLADNVGVAIIHGRVSGGTEVIDIDNADVFPRYWDEVDARCPGLIEKLTVVQTPRPGYHLIYKCDAAQGNQKLAQGPDPDNPARPKTLIETRGEGGYTLAPGSPGCCHDTGREYEHVNGPPITALPTITPEERAALFAAARVFHAFVDEVDHDQPADAKPRQGLSPGDDYNQRATWQEILPPHGWTQLHNCGSLTHWRRPGKANGWSATTGAKSAAGNELFCCFSDNAYPFEGARPEAKKPCTSYSKFAAYAVLNHGGDYSAAARALAEQGYGDRQQAHNHGPDHAQGEPKRERPEGFVNKPRPPIEAFTLDTLTANYQRLNDPVVDGLLRRGETCNIIAPPKVGKSWLAYGLGWSIITGSDWLDRFPTEPGPVLLIDNELHRSTLANRLPAVADQLGINAAAYAHDFAVWPLRGQLRSLPELAADIDRIEPGRYQAIIVDCKYRMAAPGASENDNGSERDFYNLLDQYAEQTGAAFVLIHHASKGAQGGKAVTDVGAGAGAQSRAADCHMVLREHEEDGVYVLEAAVRSFKPVEPVPLRWDFPLWVPERFADPSKLKGRLTGSEQRQAQKDKEGCDKIIAALQDGPATARQLRSATGLSRERLQRLLDLLESEGRIVSETVSIRGNETKKYGLPEPPKKDVGDCDRPRTAHVT